MLSLVVSLTFNMSCECHSPHPSTHFALFIQTLQQSLCVSKYVSIPFLFSLKILSLLRCSGQGIFSIILYIHPYHSCFKVMCKEILSHLFHWFKWWLILDNNWSHRFALIRTIFVSFLMFSFNFCNAALHNPMCFRVSVSYFSVACYNTFQMVQ